MAALTSPEHVDIRAPRPGEGAAISLLWKQLWDVHESWGSYPGAKDPAAYEHVAARIDHDSRQRGGNVVLGRHLHLIATLGGAPMGQVEGWIDRFGESMNTPWTCEVRSLVVHEKARKYGLGRSLLDALGQAATTLVHAPAVLVAEVLEPNPAHSFYRKMGFFPISWVTRIDDAKRVARVPRHVYSARPARSADAYALALLDATLAARRRAMGDVRFDPPRAVDATLIGMLAARLEGGWGFAPMPAELVVVDNTDAVRACSSLFASMLDPPFLAIRRGIVTRLSFDPAADPLPIMQALLPTAAKMAVESGAGTLEIGELTGPGTPMYRAAIECGARPWSRLVAKRYQPVVKAW